MFVNVDKAYIYIYPKTYLDISSNDHEHEQLTTSGSNFDTVVIARGALNLPVNHHFANPKCSCAVATTFW